MFAAPAVGDSVPRPTGATTTAAEPPAPAELPIGESLDSARELPAPQATAVRAAANRRVSQAQQTGPGALSESILDPGETVLPGAVQSPSDEALFAPPGGEGGSSAIQPRPMQRMVPRRQAEWEQPWFWARGEYLYWWMQGMHVPPLVTTGPSAAQPGAFGQPGTVVQFGDAPINNQGSSGGRLTLGAWLEDSFTLGVEGDYFALGTVRTNYSLGSADGSTNISRPFINTAANATTGVSGRPAVQIVAQTGQVGGTVTVDSYSQLAGTGGRVLINLCNSRGCYPDHLFGVLDGWGSNRVDFLVGYRYLELRDGVQINEYLNQLNALPAVPANTAFRVNDTFKTYNQFYGVDLGTSMKVNRGRLSWELLTKMALGSSLQNVEITGYTTVTPPNTASTTAAGGLLTQNTNIGHYTRNQFAIVPEIGMNVGYQLTPRLRVIFGYTFLYWSRISRAGDQIDLNVNQNLVPFSPQRTGQTIAPGDLRYPMFPFLATDFWAQGINTGLDFRW